MSIVTVLCAQQRTCQKVDEDFSKKMWTSHIMQTLMKIVLLVKTSTQNLLSGHVCYKIKCWKSKFGVFLKHTIIPFEIILKFSLNTFILTYLESLDLKLHNQYCHNFYIPTISWDIFGYFSVCIRLKVLKTSKISHETKWVQKIQVRIQNDFGPIVKFFLCERKFSLTSFLQIGKTTTISNLTSCRKSQKSKMMLLTGK